VLLSTRARQKSYTDKDGQKRTEIVFVVSEIVFAGDKKHEATQTDDAFLSDDDDTQLPFDLGEPEEDPA
jgi:single-stranded DNA-binding protein